MPTYFFELGDGTTVTSPVTVKFGIINMTVAPAGNDIEHSGHHLILIDQTELPDVTQSLPATSEIIHFGLGQTETVLELEPGEHTLLVMFDNCLDIPHDRRLCRKRSPLRLNSVK